MLSEMFNKNFYQIELDHLGKDDCLKIIKDQISCLTIILLLLIVSTVLVCVTIILVITIKLLTSFVHVFFIYC